MLTGRLAQTHRPLTFDELCEEAFGSGLQPWEFYEYDLKEYLLRRKGLSKYNNERYQELIIAATVPYMDKKDRARIVGNAFRGDGKGESLKEQYDRIQKRYAGIESNVKRDKNNNRG
jgi:hypothetical protein